MSATNARPLWVIVVLSLGIVPVRAQEGAAAFLSTVASTDNPLRSRRKAAGYYAAFGVVTTMSNAGFAV